GVALAADNQRLLNIGEIRGGNAGASGAYDFGLGGVGVRVSGNGTIVTQQGTIIAGLDSRNARGTAIWLSGAGNTLALAQGSTTLGDVLLSPAGGNRLKLAGGATAAVAVTGNVTFGAGGIYTVRATPAAFDRLDVTG
ncbi:hypothetical protein LZB68_08235, partial [Campylobacter lari]|nr:hypothetical protein [Campylobacter lari]